MAFICSELFSCRNNDHIFAISYENCAFTRSYKNKAVITIINIDVCSDIKYKILAVVAVLNIILLHFD
jgi:hypothetical protein